ncbi:hypothetical protein [Moraxella cuniculi]|uniref:Uncharacterized protein n=1 Tax=Moraxella cuniculi TaxID=34061 RepID=A0A448GYA0_9GAMM|nr:hypothetical protein [Moraxella cuniculi]VEG13732.1 Uncharacterised protein [Moraxella cuniculi]
METDLITIVKGIDIYNFYIENYYGLSCYVFSYKKNNDFLLCTIPGVFFEEILNILLLNVKDKKCELLERFLDGGCDFTFEFQENYLGAWWKVPDKFSFIENINSIDINELLNNEKYSFIHDIDSLIYILKKLKEYLDDSLSYDLFLHYS